MELSFVERFGLVDIGESMLKILQKVKAFASEVQHFRLGRSVVSLFGDVFEN